jgi:hypothetical protein
VDEQVVADKLSEMHHDETRQVKRIGYFTAPPPDVSSCIQTGEGYIVDALKTMW